MKGLDRSVGAVPFGFGGECVNDETGDKAPNGDHGDDPPEREVDFRSCEEGLLAGRFEGGVTADAGEREVHHRLAGGLKGNRAETGDHADHGREQKPFPRGLEVEPEQ